MEKGYQCLWLANQRLQDVLKIGKTFHVAIRHNQKGVYHLNCLQSGVKEIDWNVGAQMRKIYLIINNCLLTQMYQRLTGWNWYFFLRIRRQLPSLWINKSSDPLKQNIVHLQLKRRLIPSRMKTSDLNFQF